MCVWNATDSSRTLSSQVDEKRPCLKTEPARIRREVQESTFGVFSAGWVGGTGENAECSSHSATNAVLSSGFFRRCFLLILLLFGGESLRNGLLHLLTVNSIASCNVQ